ncbi:MAG: ATP-dependent endonuclease [Chloroflexota bacterium]
MIINSIAIKNFRCIKNLSTDITTLTAFIGRNGSGKSTMLQALNVFYDVKAPISEEDFFNGNTNDSIEITVEFKGLSDFEKSEFSRYVNGDSFAVTKQIEHEAGKISQRYYAATRQIPQIAKIRTEKTTTAKRNAWNALIDKGEMPEAPKSVRGDNPDELMDAFEAEHPELTEWIREEVQFLGPPNIGGGKLDKFTKFVYVPAVRDASEDTVERKGTPLYQLLDFIVMRRFHSRVEVQQLRDEFSEKLTDLYDSAKLTEFGDLAQEISNTLRLYVPNAQLDLNVIKPKLPEIPSPATVANLIEDDYAGSIDRKGHGLQRALIFSLLQHLAIAEPIEDVVEEVGEGSGEEERPTKDKTTISSGPALIIAIEEPELYQHPLRARHLARTLLDMSRESTLGPGGRNQILYSTHSPYFVDLERFDQLRIMRKFKHDPDEPPCTKISGYMLAQASQEMARLTNKPQELFTAQSFRARAHPVMTQSVNEGFFADAVVLVEGNTEAAALLALSRRLGSDWLSKGIAVVSVEGKTKIDRAAVVFKGFEIPTYIVFDGDNRHKGSSDEKKEVTSNRLLLKLCGAVEEDFPDSITADNYACFADDFEAYCIEAIGEEAYKSLVEQTTQKHGYTRPSQGIKNYDVVEDLIDLIYEKGHTLPLVEGIISCVNNMLSGINLDNEIATSLMADLENVDA